MRTRLTQLLGIEHPVMLAGMGGVSYAQLVTAVSEAGGFGCLGASTMDDATMVAEIAAVRGATDKPFGVDLLTAMPGGIHAQVQLHHRWRRHRLRGGPRRPFRSRRTHAIATTWSSSACAAKSPCVRAVEAGCDLVVAQGTEAGGHTGQVASLPLIPQIVDAVGGTSPWWRPVASSTAAASRPPSRSGRTGSGSAPGSSPHPKARGVRGYKERLLASHEDSDHGESCLFGEDHASGAQPLHRLLRGAPRWAQGLPRTDSAFPTRPASCTLAATRLTEGIDLDQECYPAGQGVGGITEIVPAGELVRRFVAEAETALDRLADVR